jgi:CO/xanthine dehydrogenase FAD-binding subunit
MKPAPFAYERPDTIELTLATLDRHGSQAKVLAGGQSLIPMLNLRLVHPELLIDVGRIGALRNIELAGGEVRIGAAVTHSEILESDDIARDCPLLIEAYRAVAHKGVRNRGTLGGSLCHNDPAAEMPVVMWVLDTTLVARSVAGERSIPADAFFVGLFETALRPNELLTEIRIPLPLAGHGWGFREVSQRKGDFAMMAVAALFTLEDGVCQNVRIGYASAGVAARRSTAAEAAVEGKAPSPDVFAAAAAAAVAHAQPMADYHADAGYRRDLIGSLTRRVLNDAASRAKLLY